MVIHVTKYVRYNRTSVKIETYQITSLVNNELLFFYNTSLIYFETRLSNKPWKACREACRETCREACIEVSREACREACRETC